MGLVATHPAGSAGGVTLSKFSPNGMHGPRRRTVALPVAKAEGCDPANCVHKSARRLRQIELPIAGSIGHGRALKHAVKKDSAGVIWRQPCCQDGDRVSAGASHKGGTRR